LRNIVFWDFYGLKSLQFGPTEVYSVLPWTGLQYGIFAYQKFKFWYIWQFC
jgi:hypothetical protein